MYHHHKSGGCGCRPKFGQRMGVGRGWVWVWVWVLLKLHSCLLSLGVRAWHGVASVGMAWPVQKQIAKARSNQLTKSYQQRQPHDSSPSCIKVDHLGCSDLGSWLWTMAVFRGSNHGAARLASGSHNAGLASGSLQSKPPAETVLSEADNNFEDSNSSEFEFEFLGADSNQKQGFRDSLGRTAKWAHVVTCVLSQVLWGERIQAHRGLLHFLRIKKVEKKLPQPQDGQTRCNHIESIRGNQWCRWAVCVRCDLRLGYVPTVQALPPTHRPRRANKLPTKGPLKFMSDHMQELKNSLVALQTQVDQVSEAIQQIGKQ